MRALILLPIVLSSACVSFFPPHALDIGRGATPLEVGDVQLRAGGGGGAAPFTFAVGAGGGIGVEGQVTRDLAIGFDAGIGAQGSILGVVMPTGTYFTLQYNPDGNPNLAVRGAAGMGVDYIPLAATGFEPLSKAVAPWAAASGSIVTSAKTESFEPYLVFDLGARRFLGGPDSPLVTGALGSGIAETVYSFGSRAGIRWNLGTELGLYGSMGAHMLLFIPEGVENPVPLFTPTGDVQFGVAYTF